MLAGTTTTTIQRNAIHHAYRVLPGSPHPLGATWDGAGVNVAVYAPNADSVLLCLFDNIKAKHEMVPPIPLPVQTDGVWHGYFPELRPGQLYGLRVNGPYDPTQGHRFNPNKVLLDPYAKGVTRTQLKWQDVLYGYRIGSSKGHLVMDTRDNAAVCPLGVVVETAFSWGDDTRPNIPWNETLIYEAHVKGLTQKHPDIPPELRGTYAALCCEPIIQHLKYLGVTTLELMPVHAFISEKHLADKGLTNFWGYNPLNFFSPHPQYANAIDPQEQVREFKTMVRTLHKAGIEVVLDVVYNHTCEGNQDGPTLSWKGIDNRAYYALNPSAKEWYLDFTGCGNSLNAEHPAVIRMVVDSLRYWVDEMHVDGFRFDLTPTLGRRAQQFDPHGSLLMAIQQDPVLSKTKLIAEPWDVGPNGYQVGAFPRGWREWNDRFRDETRQFWNFEGIPANQFATVLAGSSDRFSRPGKGPTNSINFVTCHDGFTLMDVVSYNTKHNYNNGEENRDGCNNNRSYNHGAEGPTNAAAVRALRNRQRRNLMASVMLSFGVPMLLYGDEMSRTQEGNNNTYCQDNTLTWVDWRLLDDEKTDFLKFVRNLSELRRHHVAFRRQDFFKGHPNALDGMADILWLGPNGTQVTLDDWHNPKFRTLGVLIEGSAINVMNHHGEVLSGDSLFYVINARHSAVDFELPYHRRQRDWEMVFTTTEPDGLPHKKDHLKLFPGGSVLATEALSLYVFRLR